MTDTPQDGAPVASSPAATPSASAPAPAATGPPSAPDVLASQAQIEALREALLPTNRAGLLPEKVAELERAYFAAIEAEIAPRAGAPPTAPPTRPAVALDAEQWTRVLGPPRGPDDEAEGQPQTWDAAALNEVRAALKGLGFPAMRVVSEFAEAEVAMAATSWSEEGGRRALVEAHGPATAQAMIQRAQDALELLFEDPLGKRYVERWEAEGGLNSPHLVEALARLMDAQPHGSDAWIALNLKRAARWEAQRRGQSA
jgi:hypothetical protein